MNLLLWLLSVASVSGAAHPGARDLVRRFEARYRAARTLEAVFLERYVEAGGLVRAESGRAYFRRPGKMRWEYESPEAKLFVSDGKTVWFYVPADRTVIRTSVKESADWRMPFALLTREPKLSRICARIVLGEPREALEAGHAVLRCTPKGTRQDIREILIEVDEKTGDVGRVVVREAGGVELDFRFANWRRNVPLPESQFRFAAPPGVAIVDGPTSEKSGN
jgi:outer membrane lipoprotein carrier protein